MTNGLASFCERSGLQGSSPNATELRVVSHNKRVLSKPCKGGIYTAQGETLGKGEKTNRALQGRDKDLSGSWLSRPCRAQNIFQMLYPGLHPGLKMSRPSGAKKKLHELIAKVQLFKEIRNSNIEEPASAGLAQLFWPLLRLSRSFWVNSTTFSNFLTFASSTSIKVLCASRTIVAFSILALA